MNIIQERIFKDYMTGKYSCVDLGIKYGMSNTKVSKLMQTHKDYDEQKIKQIKSTLRRERIRISFARNKNKDGYSDEDRRRKEALDAGYLRCMEAGLPWNLVAMDEALKGIN